MIPGIVAQASTGTSNVAGGVVELLLGFNGTNGQTLIRDEGVRSRPVVMQGNAALTTAQAKFGASSCTFDGNDDAIFVAHGENLEFGSGPFTVDFWYRRTTTSGIRHLIGERPTGSQIGWAITLLSANTIELIITADGSTGIQITSTSAPAANVWNHVAVDRDATGVVRLYVNGVMEATAPFATSVFTKRFGVAIGAQFDFGADFTGQMDEIRIVNGAAMYANDGGFPVPTLPYSRPTQDLAPADDPYFANVLFLNGFDGTRGTNSYQDDSSYHRPLVDLTGTANPANNNQIAPNFNGVFEEDALQLFGTTLHRYADSNDWAFGTDPFTLELWVYQSAWTVWQLIAHRGSGTTDVAWSVATIAGGAIEFIGNDGTNSVQFSSSTTGTDRPLRSWAHIAVDRDATGKYRIYINGKMVASSTSTVQNLKNISRNMTIGSDDAGNIAFSGFMDEIRITRGVARYASDAGFPTPEKRFPRNEAAPGWSVNPSIASDSGFYGPGDVVRCNNGTHNLRKLSRQWFKDGVAISGATGGSYVLQAGDIGSNITCQVTGRNYKGIVSQLSNAVAVVAATYDTGALAPAGDMQSGTDRLIPAGDMQGGSDVLLWKERLS